jgi:DNA-directed RNA polymerase specialized sigma24 family protein
MNGTRPSDPAHLARADREKRLHGLIVAAQRGDESAYAGFLRETAALLRPFFRRRLAQLPDDIEDLVQETLLAVHNTRHTYDPSQPVTTWMVAIARYKLVDLLRARAGRTPARSAQDDLDELASAAEPAARSEARSARAAGALPDKQRLPIECVKIEGCRSRNRTTHRPVGVASSRSASWTQSPRGACVSSDEDRQLITALASQAEAVDPRLRADGWRRRRSSALCRCADRRWRFGINPELASDARLPMFWGRAAFAALLAIGAALLVDRLARPGAEIRHAWRAAALPLLGIWIVGALVLAGAAPADRAALVLGSTWRQCPWNIALLSLPAFVLLLALLRSLAPTRLRSAGAAAGTLAGALGMLAYGIHCPELAAPFIAIWYVLGVAILPQWLRDPVRSCCAGSGYGLQQDGVGYRGPARTGLSASSRAPHRCGPSSLVTLPLWLTMSHRRCQPFRRPCHRQSLRHMALDA